MDLTNKKTIKELLAQYGAMAEKKFGQHFILSKKALTQMIAAAEIKKGGTIIEIGPGLGTLTQELAQTGAKIIAIEKDLLMVGVLKKTLADYKNIKIIQADARQISMSDIDIGNRYFKYKIVANLPYNIATFLIHKWLELKNPPELMVLMIQKEVAQRICAKPPRMNLLAASVQFYAEIKIIGYVPAEAFWPRPKVDSAITKLVIKQLDNHEITQLPNYFHLVKILFKQPRKTILNNLEFGIKNSGVEIAKEKVKEKIVENLKKININPQNRPQDLAVNQIKKLSEVFY